MTLVDPATVWGGSEVGGHSPIEIGSAETLNDMRIWPRNSPIIGSQDLRSSCPVLVAVDVVIC